MLDVNKILNYLYVMLIPGVTTQELHTCMSGVTITRLKEDHLKRRKKNS